jgi:polyisoprenoid-binding protein YceI
MWVRFGNLTVASFALVLVSGLFGSAPADAGRFEFDQRRTEVRFAYTWGYWTHRGRFTNVSGTLDYDDARPEKCQVNATIATASLTTGVALFDDELKGASFFNAEQQPVIAFKSHLVRPTGAGTADVSGEMTINGVTKPVTLAVHVRAPRDPAFKNKTGDRVFVGKGRIQRSAFKMTGYQAFVADEVEIEIAAVLRPRP